MEIYVYTLIACALAIGCIYPLSRLMGGYIGVLLWFTGHLTGWPRLARRFPAAVVPQGPVCNGCILRMWSVGGYNNGLTVTLGDEGLHVQMMPMFRVGHPPILFPWSVAEPMREYKVLGATTRWVVPLRVNERRLELTLPEAARSFVDEHVARSQNSLDGPFSNTLPDKR